MKNIKFFIGLLLVNISCVPKEENQESIISDGAQVSTRSNAVWDYPMKPDMDEWKTFQTYEEMVKSCQIPENILFLLSTEDLTEICLQYPLLYCVFAFNFLSDGLDKMFTDFNGIRELYARKDASYSLMSRYVQKIQSFSFLDEAHSEVDKGLFIISISALEALLSQATKHDIGSHKEILQCLVDGYEAKLKYIDYFMGFGFRTNCFSRAHVITSMDKLFIDRLPEKELNLSLYSGMTDKITIDIINELSYQLIR